MSSKASFTNAQSFVEDALSAGPTLPLGTIGAPVAVAASVLPDTGAGTPVREVLVRVAGAPLRSRVYLESLPLSGPREQIRALALPAADDAFERAYRASVPAGRGTSGTYVPVAWVDGKEHRGEPIDVLARSAPSASGMPLAKPTGDPPAPSSSVSGGVVPLPAPRLELFAHAEAALPNATVFGPTPEGIRIAFYISNGRWEGPRIRARYKSEGGDWMLVREDGIGVPSARATLETHDGALLYYQLTGSVDLGPEGYARCLAKELPDSAPLAVVAQISTSSPHWRWLNRLTLVGAGTVNLKLGVARYGLYSISPNLAR